MKKIIAIIMVLLLTAACFTGCNPVQNTNTSTSETDLSYIQNKGTMIIGITDFEPMDYQVDGEWTGFDAELALKVCEKLGVQAQFQEISWKMKETELSSKTIDCIWNGLTYDEERAQNMSLTDYYMLNRQVVVVKADNAEKFSSAEALKNATIAAESGSAGEDYIKENLASANYIEKDAQIDVLTELLAGTVDAGVLDYTMAYYLVNKADSNFSSLKIVENVIDVQDEYYSVAFRKGSDVTAKVNDILSQLKADGTVENIAKKYGLQDAIVK